MQRPSPGSVWFLTAPASLPGRVLVRLHVKGWGRFVAAGGYLTLAKIRGLLLATSGYFDAATSTSRLARVAGLGYQRISGIGRRRTPFR
jgi:hypothetical protein